MNEYVFLTDQFGIDDDGIHFLRSGYNYKTIAFDSISSITIEKGKQVNNRLLLLFFGILLTSFGLIAGVKIIYEFFILNYPRTYDIEEFVVPVLPLAFGIFSLYYSFKTGLVLKFQVDNKSKSFPLGQKKYRQRLAILEDYLSTSIFTKHKFNNTGIELVTKIA